jgi:hypothetical protein
MCDIVIDAPDFAASLSLIFLAFARFQFLVFVCYVIHRMLRRIMR